ncbi:hypothetical protein [Sulfuricurvum sp.]|uniref:bacteriophage T4 gp5 trimerisation domain-containing protein n=1 Tax=Sulfuricurvum sp. TaxID=2025608 RepID=UPI00261B2DEF|nr:hypothetical protein [Sulfuricurvum sp.]MDD3597506.1 hypothetical protein [Sulfuricurvum sp.]
MAIEYITAIVSNGENAIPYDLPNTKTQSYIKTQTTPQYKKSEGYNEILFEDGQNSEQLNMRAQKDYSLLVLHDATEHIQHDRSERVDNNEDVTIHGYRKERVNKSKTETIDIAKALTIGAGYQVSVGASKNETVGISSTEEVGLLKHTIVGEKYEITVGKSQITFHANGDIFIRGDDIDILGTNHIEIIAPKVYINGGEADPNIFKLKFDATNLTTDDLSHKPYKVYSIDEEKMELMQSGTLDGAQQTSIIADTSSKPKMLTIKANDDWIVLDPDTENGGSQA